MVSQEKTSKREVELMKKVSKLEGKVSELQEKANQSTGS